MVSIHIDEQRFEATWRTSTYFIYNCMLALQIASQKVHKTDPAEYLVFSVVACANLQRRMRELGVLRDDAVDYIPTDEINVPMSRRQVAEATGLPRETVRRIVQRLIKRGLLIEAPDGYIMVPAGLMRNGDYAWAPEVVMGPVAGLMKAMLDIGVIKLDMQGEVARGSPSGGPPPLGPDGA